jgi:hypothetical protein
MDNISNICPSCHQTILPGYYFCPNCGFNLKSKPVSISISAQIGTYILAVLLPPLGLWPGLKYLAEKNPQAKRIGMIAIILTLISAVLMIWGIFALFGNYINEMQGALGGL